jgi:hypothetical protein
MFKRKMLIPILLLAGGTIGITAGSGMGVQAKLEQSVGPRNCFAVLQPDQKGGGATETYCGEGIGPSLTATPPFTLDLNPGQHCVVEIDPLRPGERASNMRPVGCFATFSEAIAAATGGEVQLPTNVGPAEVTAEMLAPAQSNIVIGIDYIYSNFQGNSLVWKTAHTPGCSDGSTFETPNMPSGWNDVVSSARSYAGCNHYYHYEHTYWTGAVRDCGGSCATMGVMDNATSSERWTP